jgi:trigger factor
MNPFRLVLGSVKALHFFFEIIGGKKIIPNINKQAIMGVVTRENIGLLNDKITVKVAQGDYLPSFEKALKEYSKKANIPGFRKGMVPAGLIKKMYGNSVFADEVLRSVEKELTSYMEQEKLDIFAQPLPLPDNDARQINMSKPDEYAFAFEVGLKPHFDLVDLSGLHPLRYKIEVTPEMIDEEIERLRSRNGKMTEPELVSGDDNVLNLSFIPSDQAGEPTPGAARKENSLLVKYFSPDFRSTLIGKTKGDWFVLQPSKAFDQKERDWVVSDLGLSKDDAAAADAFYRVEITKVGLIEKSPMNEDFFKVAFPDKSITTEEEFRKAISEGIEQYWDAQSRTHLQHALYHELLEQTKIEFPESFLKRWLLSGGEKPKTQEEVELEFPTFTNQLKWTLILDKIVRENSIEVVGDDLKNFARQQLMGYMGMGASTEEQPWIEDYVNRMMQDRRFVEDAVQRIRTDKVLGWAETQVQPKDQPVGREEFVKMQEQHAHHH